MCVRLFQDVVFTSGAAWVPPLTSNDGYAPPSPPADGRGVLNGQGGRWWGVPGIGYAVRGENRPRLLHLHAAARTVVERLYLLESPYWTFWCDACEELEVRHSKVSAARTSLASHGLVDLSAFNTDGFDVAGQRIWIHDVEVTTGWRWHPCKPFSLFSFCLFSLCELVQVLSNLENRRVPLSGVEPGRLRGSQGRLRGRSRRAHHRVRGRSQQKMRIVCEASPRVSS